MVRFLHAADLHLDSPMRGLERYDGCPAQQMREATRQAFIHLVDLALRERVDFVVLAGDLYDGDWRDFNTGLFFLKEISRLRDARIPVAFITGNHDAANKMTRSLRIPDHLRMLPTDMPASVEIVPGEVFLHGQGFGQAKVLEDISQRYPKAVPGTLNIGLLHTCAAGAEGHEPYAPCTLEGLRAKGYDYWALGHIHHRRILCEDPYIVFPGNTQGRSVRETGAKGCYLVSLEESGEVRLEFQPLDAARWEVVTLAPDTWKTTDDFLEAASAEFVRLSQDPSIPLAVRVQIAGVTRLHREFLAKSEHWTQQLRSLANNETPGNVWVEKVVWQTKPAEAVNPSMDAGPLTELQALLAEYRAAPAALQEQCASWDDWQTLERRLQETLLGMHTATVSDWATILQEAEALLHHRFTGEGA